MRHQVRGRKLNRTKSHRDAMFSNMATSLFEHKKIHTTEAKAKELRPFAESLITKAKKALAREKQNLLPEGHTIDIHNRRLVGRVIRSKAVLQELFDAIAPTVEARNGGYTRIIKTGIRYGDAGRKAIIELVDWSAPQDGVISLKRKKKKTSKKKVTASAKNKIAESKVAEQQEVEQSNEEVVVIAKDTVEELKEENSIESNDAGNTDAETKDNEKNAETNTNN